MRVSAGGALATAGLLSFSRMAQAMGIGAVSRFTGLPLDALPTTCTLCPARCGILGFVENDGLKGLLGNPKDPNSRGKICIRGLAGVNLQKDGERILHPMVRHGERGGGIWKRITWDEAFQRLALLLQGSRSGGPRADGRILVQMGQGELLTRRFLQVLAAQREITLVGGPRSPSSDLAHRLTWGEGRGVPDVLHARTILNFGSNPYSHDDLYVPFIQRLIQARTDHGAKLVTFDVRLSQTAGLSDEWLPVAPGTDALVALAMAHVIVEDGLHDRAFMERWTNVGEEELRGHLAPYTPELAQGQSGVPAREIRRIAAAFATRGPSVAFSGAGVSGQANGTQAERAILLLNAIVGNIDRPGGYCLPRSLTLDEPDLPSSQEGRFLQVDPSKALLDLLDGPASAELYLIYMDNPAYNLPQSGDIQGLLVSEERIVHLVVMDTHLSETAALADLVLPAATYLEGWGLESPTSMEMNPFVTLRQPVVAPVAEAERLRQAKVNRFDLPVTRPRGEALSWNDLALETARRMRGDMAKAFAFRDVEDYLERCLSQIAALSGEGGLAYLRRNGVWFDPHGRADYASHVSGGFPTPSGRMEIYSERLAERGFSPLPSYSPPERAKGAPLTLVPFRDLPSEGPPNAKWLCELSHENPAWINESTAKGLGLKDGDRIHIVSQESRVIARVHLTQGIHPEAIALSRGLGHWAYGHFAQARPFRGEDPDSHLIWWQRQGNGIHIEPLIPIRLDPVSDGQAWMGTGVKIEKV